MENITMMERDVRNDEHWAAFSNQWLIRSDTTYLNHGSFGPPPQVVRQSRRTWIDALDAQPMDFYLREFEPALDRARQAVAEFVGCAPHELVFVENATAGMNIVAESFPLTAGDEVVINNHEYGAVVRIWERACSRVGARLITASLPAQIESSEQVVDCLMDAVNDKTRLLIVSHITSPTALVMPVEDIVNACRRRGVAVCVDGPHAPAQIELNVSALDCDFYLASCHKWLSASLGSGFAYVHPRWHGYIEPPVKSWGRLLPAVPKTWDEEFIWSGTRDPSCYLSLPSAIDFMTHQVGLEAFRQRTRFLAAEAERALCDEFSTVPLAKRSDGWYASMAHVPLPSGDFSDLQHKLWHEYHIEVPVIRFENRWHIRVSFHLYNNLSHIETLRFALRKFLL